MATAFQPAAFAAFPALGSTIVVGATNPVRLGTLTAHVRDRIAAVDRALSRFRPDSELAWHEAHAGQPTLASPLFLEVLDLACRAAASTDGWFDPTVRDALEAAGYDRGIEQVEAAGPGPARPAQPAGRWREVQYDLATRLVLLPPGVRLDFGGIGKGFAADDALRDVPLGDDGALVSAGGDIVVAGTPPEGGWPCEVAARPEDAAATTILLRRGALATSGLGRRQWRRHGEALHHLIDPRTSQPGRSPWRIVTAAARQCAVAEVAAKVGWLRGANGPGWVAGLGLAARFQGMDGQVVTVGPWPASQGAA